MYILHSSQLYSQRFQFLIVTFIHKKISNYLLNKQWNISVVSSVVKVKEKVTESKPANYIETNNILFENQFNFSKGLDTV